MCGINRNQLLDLFFHELKPRHEKKVEIHVRDCPECGKYLTLLKQTDLNLRQLPDIKPGPDTFDRIMKKIEARAEIQPKPKPAQTIWPLLWIPLTILAMLATIILLKNNLPHLAFWQAIENLWVVRRVGPLGVSVFLVFVAGIALTMALTPILIFESGMKPYRFILK